MKRYRYFLYLMILGVFAMVLYSCASTGSPSGGPRDKTPPGLVVEKSSPNFVTNHVPKKIELVFDEWIELKNQQREILISPPFFKQPKIAFRGKKVTVEFPEDEPLRPDATYTINFGSSIVDFTESNAAEGFRYVFATGDKIDSLSFKGSIVDAYGGESIKDVLVMVYDVLGDSVVLSEKPFYYTRADNDGTFLFENVKNDTFKVVVIEDLNLNYLLDDELERLAFLDSTFVLHDSAAVDLTFRLFMPEQRVRILKSSSKVPGVITVVFNQPADGVDYQYLYPNDFVDVVETVGDTAKFWFSKEIDSAGLVFGVDTLDFMIKAFDSLFYQKSIIPKGDNRNSGALAPFDSLVLEFSAPIAGIDTSLISLTDKPIVRQSQDSTSVKGIKQNGKLKETKGNRQVPDSLISKRDTVVPSEPSVITESLDSSITADTMVVDTVMRYDCAASFFMKSLIIRQPWKEGHDYRLMILPGAITDIYGRTSDTTIFDFKTASMDQFGSIRLSVVGLDSSQQYVVLLRKGDKVIDTRTVDSTGMDVLQFVRLPVSTYNIHLIKDDNRDGAWTTGDYWSRRQPELVKTFELEKLRENWDLEATIEWQKDSSSLIDSLGQTGVDSTMIRIEGDVPADSMRRSKTPRPTKTPRSGSGRQPKGRGAPAP